MIPLIKGNLNPSVSDINKLINEINAAIAGTSGGYGPGSNPIFNTLTVTGASSFDNNDITTNGSGTLTAVEFVGGGAGLTGVGGGLVSVISNIGQTANASITFPAKSVPVFLVFRETSGNSMGSDIFITFGSGSPSDVTTIMANQIIQSNNVILGFDNNISDYYSSSPVSLLISSSDWGTAHVDTFVYYITLP
jgi:hypothetical protein